MDFNASQQIWKTLLTWELESRYLIRYLIKHGFYEAIEQRKSFLKEAKEKAALHIEEKFADLLP